MKKNLLIIFFIILSVAAAILAYFETHFPHFEFEQVRVSEEAALKDMPDAVFTGEDEALLRAVLALPEVREALGTEESLEFAKEICGGLKEYLPSGTTECKVYYVGSLSKSVNVVCEFGEETTIQYLVNEDLSHFEKAVAVYRRNARKIAVSFSAKLFCCRSFMACSVRRISVAH